MTRKACREGHYDCIGIASRDDRCWSDPSRCTHYANGKAYRAARHLYDGEDQPLPGFPTMFAPTCSRCGHQGRVR